MRWVCGSIVLAACIVALSGRYQVLVLDPGPPYSGINLLKVDSLLGTIEICDFTSFATATCTYVETEDWRK